MVSRVLSLFVLKGSIFSITDYILQDTKLSPGSLGFRAKLGSDHFLVKLNIRKKMQRALTKFMEVLLLLFIENQSLQKKENDRALQRK